VRVEEFVFERLKLVVIELELELEGAISDPSALPYEVYRLIEHCIEVHGAPLPVPVTDSAALL
jgi:hypothetical protein